VNTIDISTVPYATTHIFSKLVNDYVNEKEELKQFITNFPTIDSITKAIELKKKHQIDRDLLTSQLKIQYSKSNITDLPVSFSLLKDENTFTICTAHQPLIFTGHLYFIYKILHAIKLAEECKLKFPICNFVPVFYIGSEDNDIEEIGELQVENKKLQWNATQTGACGSMDTSSLKPILDEVKKYLSLEIEDEKRVIDIFEKAYSNNYTLANATRIIVHELFGKYGLLVIDGNDIGLKKCFSSILKKELIERFSSKIVSTQIEKLQQHYSIQATPREINLFYLKEGLRERIVKENNLWKVVNTNIEFSEVSILEEVNKHPERFSPNVILRPLYQEMILPNICFIGGGGELAYWLQLKSMFDEVNVFFPILFLRNSVAVATSKVTKKIHKWELTNDLLFLKKHELLKYLVKDNNVLTNWNQTERLLLDRYNQLDAESGLVSPTLNVSIKAHIQKIKNIHDRILNKINSHTIRNEKDLAQDIDIIFKELFPDNSLQERHTNVVYLIKHFGLEIFDILLKNQEAFGKGILILMQV
jgi:bacillithiol biosynthesis cysteine-adding enzyme BshC